ncbi:hypothetical protein GCM10027265_34830 [Jatrophihabitans fulvus]
MGTLVGMSTTIPAGAETAAPARPIRVVLADDKLPFRIALRQMLRRAADIEVVGEAADGAEAVALTERLQPDLVLLDVRMPVMDGPTAARTISSRWPGTHVVLCSSHDRADLPEDLGAPYVPKELLDVAAVRAAAHA